MNSHVRSGLRHCAATAVAALILVAGVTVSPAAETTPQRQAAHLLRPGDVLEITVYEHPELDLRTRVDMDGTIRFPLCGSIRAAGRTATDMSSELSRLLVENNIADAQVFAFVTTYVPRRVFVLGAVEGSGTKALELQPEGKMTALQAVSAAGGFSERADLRSVFVLREGLSGAAERIVVDVRAIMDRNAGVRDIELLPGDTVMVPTATPVSVFGMVEEPGAFDIDTSNVVTAAEMISRAGGFKEGADRDEVMLLRRDPAGTMTNRIVPLGRLMAGLGGDAGEVDPGDIIMVTPRDKVYVLGQVKSAGAFEIHPETPMTITRAIAMANGFDRLAAQNAVLLIRDGKVREINLARALKADGDTSIDEVIQPGDMIFVSESRW